MTRCLYCATLAVIVLVPHAAASQIEGWVTDSYLASYEGPPPHFPTGSAHLPAIVRATVNESEIAVIGWDIFTPERDEILLSMLLSTTWTSPMEPWQESEIWFVSSYQMPMSDASMWFLWYRDKGSNGFELGAPPFLSPESVPQYVVTDQQQRRWSFSQPFLIIPEPGTFVLLAGGALLLLFWPRNRTTWPSRRFLCS
jgi:hypothetical protein